MSNLEKLVPPLEECKKIPKGAFPNSALVWGYTGEGYDVISREVWKLVEILSPAVPAPTLEEILGAIEEIPGIKFLDQGICDTMRRTPDGFCSYPLTAELALRLWFRVREAGTDPKPPEAAK